MTEFVGWKLKQKWAKWARWVRWVKWVKWVSWGEQTCEHHWEQASDPRKRDSHGRVGKGSVSRSIAQHELQVLLRKIDEHNTPICFPSSPYPHLEAEPIPIQQWTIPIFDQLALLQTDLKRRKKVKEDVKGLRHFRAQGWQVWEWRQAWQVQE